MASKQKFASSWIIINNGAKALQLSLVISSLLILIMTIWDGEGKSHRAYWSDEENNVHGTLINHGND